MEGLCPPQALPVTFDTSLQRRLMNAEGRIYQLTERVRELENGLAAAQLARPEQTQPRHPTLDAILRAVCAMYETDLNTLLRNGRASEVVQPRQCAMWLGRTLTRLSLPQIGRQLGLDHTTVLHGIQRHAARMQDDPAVAELTRELMRQLERPASTGKHETQEAFNHG